MSSPYTTLGLPPDGVAWGALLLAPVLALLLAWQGPKHARLTRALTARVLLPILAFGAALLSAGYVAFYLRYGPRIVDATSYYLQARAIAAGHFAFPVPEPLGSFNGRFLLANDSGSLSVIFPPGYAAVLALGFLAHAPLLVGPVIGALLVLTTHGLAREVSGRSDVAIVAAGWSVLCAALRYHTADTMSHGLCALLLSAGALYAMRRTPRSVLVSGLCCGWLIATRPVSGVVGLALALCLLDRTPRRLVSFGLALLPGVGLLLAYQHAATGSFWTSTQLAYYALADGPPGCFRYGFGRGIGCLFEHGEYVRARLPGGYGLREAASVTVRRLAVHSIDIANAAPLSGLCFVGVWQARSEPRARALFIACLGLMLAYAPFYFDASYPGGGARLFADVLPFEHVLLALAVVRLRWQALALPFSLLGFAIHGSYSHRALADREGGYPMFQAQALARAGVSHGLVFVDTDHGFNLGHDPGQLDAQRGVVVARYEHDAHDFELWDRLGRPPSYRYSYAASGPDAGRSTVDPYVPGTSRRYEAEAEWPALGVSGAWVQPDFFPCASGGRGLRLHPTGQSPESGFAFRLPPLARAHGIALAWVRSDGPATRVQLSIGNQIASAIVPAGPADCISVELAIPESPADQAGLPAQSSAESRVRFQASRPGMLDYIELLP
ncbi:MAG: hypothetical protein ABUL62_15445 [Myxococcales bacterium]